MRLDDFNNQNFDRGASDFKEFCWLLFCGFLFSTWLPGSSWRVTALRLFGARIGIGVVIKPNIKVKFPWRLSIGDHCWIGEAVWIDNLDHVRLGSHVCLSQGTYICTGSHDWSKSTFDLIVKPITIDSHVWVGAMSRIAPGVHVGEGAIVGFGSVVLQAVDPWTINKTLVILQTKDRSH